MTYRINTNTSLFVNSSDDKNLAITPSSDLESFLQKARSLQPPRTTRTSILTPYREKILFALEHGINLQTILKTLQEEGIKTSYDNLRAYILRQKKGSKNKKLLLKQ